MFANNILKNVSIKANQTFFRKNKDTFFSIQK